jgi:phage/plasmid-like protein (TIGR03299 family)
MIEMSAETAQWLNTNTLIGFTAKRGNAWHYRAEDQGDESNHYVGAIPVADVHRRLFDWSAVEGLITATSMSEDGVLVNSDNRFKAIMRSDSGEILGIFKDTYRVHQFDEWLLQNVASLLDADLQIGSAGLLRGGAQAWVQIEMEETLSVRGVEFRPFLTAATSHDGSLATTYVTGAQVVVCDNTLAAGLANADAKLKVRHSVNSMSKLGDARDALGIVYSVADAFTAEVEALMEQRVTNPRFSKFVSAYTNPENAEKRSPQMETKADVLQKLWKDDERVAPWKNTAYGVVAAVNTYVHHEGSVRGGEEKRAERNMARVVTGDHVKLDQSTLDLLARV